MSDLEYLKRVTEVINETAKQLKAANDHAVIDKVCPYCGAKHTGIFQACSPCKGAVDSGDRDSYPGYMPSNYRGD